MPSINIIAERRTEKRRQEKNIQRLIYGIVAEFGIVLIVSSVMVGRVVSTRNHISDLDDQIKSLQAKVDEIRKLQNDTAAHAPQVAALRMARNSTLYWYTAIEKVSASLPAKAWLTSVSTTGQLGGQGDENPAKLNVAATATDQYVVGDTMLKLNTYPMFGQVLLSAASQNQIAKHVFVSYQLIVDIKPNAAFANKGGANVQKS